MIYKYGFRLNLEGVKPIKQAFFVGMTAYSRKITYLSVYGYFFTEKLNRFSAVIYSSSESADCLIAYK